MQTGYSPEEISYFWQKAQSLPVKLERKLAEQHVRQDPDNKLYEAVRNWAGRRLVFTVTGRLRAKASFMANGPWTASGGAQTAEWQPASKLDSRRTSTYGFPKYHPFLGTPSVH